MRGNEQLSISLVHCAVTARLLTVQMWTCRNRFTVTSIAHTAVLKIFQSTCKLRPACSVCVKGTIQIISSFYPLETYRTVEFNEKINL